MIDLAAQCAFDYFRGPGPGGQHRNKKLTGVRARHRATGLAGVSSRFRSREMNRKAALASLARLLDKLQHKPAPRRPTRPGRAARERRLAEKKRRGRLKKERAAGGAEE